MSDHELRTLLRLLDAMDNHSDQKTSDHDFMRQAASALDLLNQPPVDDPRLDSAVRALEDLVSAARCGPLPGETYGHLRLALAELEEYR